MMKFVLLTLTLTLSASSGGPAEARKAVEDAVTGALGVLRETRSTKERVEKLTGLADELFAWKAMAQSALGSEWRELAPNEREHFAELFEDLIANQYRDTLTQFQGDEKVEFGNAKTKGSLVEVPTTVITHSNERVPVSYFLKESDGTWQVHDFSVEGVSMVNHYRSSYRRFLTNRSYEQLVKRLEQKRSEVTSSK